MRLEVSHSSCSVARACPMKYKWRYVDGYKPIRKAIALTLGSITHEAFDLHYKNRQNISNFIVEKMDNMISEAMLPDAEDLEVIKATSLGMWENFPFKNLVEFEEIQSEKEFRVPVSDMYNVTFVGKSDRLLKKDGQWWIGELKTSGLPFQAFKNRMTVSDQVTAYVYAWRQLGIPVEGVVFDFVKKPLLRKNSRETCFEYCERIRKDYAARPDFYFQRHYEYRSDEELQRWVVDIRQTINVIRDAWKGRVYRNPDACWNYNSECCYKKICFTDKPDPLTLELYFEQRKPNYDEKSPEDRPEGNTKSA